MTDFCTFLRKLVSKLVDGTNQGAKHFADYCEKFPELIPSLEARLGLEEGTFNKSPERFDAFTAAAKSVIENGEVIVDRHDQDSEAMKRGAPMFL